MTRYQAPPLSQLTRRQVAWISAGFVMTLATLPGQTIFIAQFNTALRHEYGLSNGAFGGIYMLATISSAACLIWAGGLADRLSPRRLGIISLCCLALVAVALALQNHVATLAICLAGLRFFGQGMLLHVASTAMSRWFNRFRGRALSLSRLGIAFGEASLPFLITLSIVQVGWRPLWFVTAAVLVVILMPAIWFLLRESPEGKRAIRGGHVNPDAALALHRTGQEWTRGKILQDALFYLIIPGVMAPSAIGTLYTFHQANLVLLKGWDLSIFTATIPVLSATVILSALTAGGLVDRFKAWRLLPFFLLPMAFGCLIVGTMSPQWAVVLMFVGFGLTSGLTGPILGALCVEVYGTAHVGVVRALAAAATVSASALGPGLAGFLIDIGFDLQKQSFIYAAYCGGCALLYVLFRRRLATRVAEVGQI